MATEFDVWLNNKLRELNTDETVFSSYISGILDGEEESLSEKTEALEGILSEIIETQDIETLLNEILEKWKISHPIVESPEKILEDVDIKLAKLLESKKIATIVQKEYTPEELRIRKQILEQYSQLSADEDEEDDGGATASASTTEQKSSSSSGGGGGSGGGIEKNTNALDVQQAMKERREQARLDSKQKKDKDKEDREKQKQLREEKKEKRKTVKGERRR